VGKGDVLPRNLALLPDVAGQRRDYQCTALINVPEDAVLALLDFQDDVEHLPVHLLIGDREKNIGNLVFDRQLSLGTAECVYHLPVPGIPFFQFSDPIAQDFQLLLNRFSGLDLVLHGLFLFYLNLFVRFIEPWKSVFVPVFMSFFFSGRGIITFFRIFSASVEGSAG